MLDESVEMLVKPNAVADEVERAVDGKGSRGQHSRAGRPEEATGEVRSDLHRHCSQRPVGTLPENNSFLARCTRRSGWGNQQVDTVMAISEG